MNRFFSTSFFLRLGLAFTMIYAAGSAFFRPENWVGFFPAWMFDIAPFGIGESGVLFMFSLAEVLLSLWLLSGWRIRHAALVTSILMAGIVAFNIQAMDLVFRDIGLCCVALALYRLDS